MSPSHGFLEPPLPAPLEERSLGTPIALGAGMHALLTTLLLAAAPQVPGTATPAPTEAPAARRSVWIQPIGTAFVGLAMRENSAFYLPLGANLPLGDNPSRSLGVELTVTTGSMASTYEYRGGGSRSAPNYWRVLAAAGPVYSLSGRPLSGPFVQPKLLTNFSYEPEYGYGDYDHAGGASLELHLGLDVGWQFTVGSVYIAPVLGLSVGYGFNMPGGGRRTLSGGPAFVPSRVLHPEFVGYEPMRGPAPVLGINLNLLRLGTTF
jgi:hypothetical protein